MIENKGISLVDFINNIESISEGHDRYEVQKVIKKEEIQTDERFFKWTTASHDEDQSFCPKDCHNCMIVDDMDYDCIKIGLNYYVNQWTTNMDGDSYAGDLVYPLDDYYVFVSYEC